jgi:CheY-like chemotaxis protein
MLVYGDSHVAADDIQHHIFSEGGLMAKRILVIDDCKLTLALARDILEEAGFEVVTVETGIEANRHLYRARQPDLLLIDVVMPMLPGDRKVRLLRQREETSEIPIVLMSTKTEPELRELARYSGANGYLCKPLKKEALVHEVKRHLRAGADPVPGPPLRS